jgi:Glycine cleavage T-protein C-terminal barrel domain
MRQLMGRPGGRGVTVTMIVNALASEQLGVPRSTIRRWLADDIQRGLAERAGPGFYRLRQHADPHSQHRRRRSRLAHPEHPKSGTTDRRRTGAIPPARRPRGRSGAGPPSVRQAAACKGASSGACSRRVAVCRAGEAADRAARHRSAAKRALPAWPTSRWSPASTPCPARRGGDGANALGVSEQWRIESGIYSYSADMGLEHNPFEVTGLEEFVEEKETSYVGKEALERIRQAGVHRKLVGIRLDGRPIQAPCWRRWPVYAAGERAGQVTSAIHSPRLEANIGFAWVPAALAAEGETVMVDSSAGRLTATVTPLPFLQPEAW